MKMKKFVAALTLLFLTQTTLVTVAAEVNNQPVNNTQTQAYASPGELNLGGSFITGGAPNLVTRPVSLNIDGLTNYKDAFNILNRGDGSANFTRNLDSVGFITYDDYIENSLYFRGQPQQEQQYQQQQQPQPQQYQQQYQQQQPQQYNQQYNQQPQQQYPYHY